MKNVMILWGLLAAAPLFAQDLEKAFPLYESQLTTWMMENPGKTLGDMEPGKVLEILSTSKANQIKQQWVYQTLALSFFFPGAGHFRSGDALGGTLFTAGSLTLLGGGIALAVVLLPGDLQYFNPFVYSIESTEAKFKSYSYMDYLPSAGALVSAMVFHHLLGVWAAADVRLKAVEKAQVSSVEVLAPGMGGMLMGARMRF